MESILFWLLVELLGIVCSSLLLVLPFFLDVEERLIIGIRGEYEEFIQV